MAKRKTEAEQEAEVAKRHVKLAQKRTAELAANPMMRLPGLTQQIEAEADRIEAIPEDHGFTMEQTDAMDECRCACHRLMRGIEAIFESLHG